jgi:MFS family permease
MTTILLFADQNLLSPNLTAIATEFWFTNEERDRKLGGDIALAFFILGAPASFLVGLLFADQSDRSLLFAWTVGISEGACFATFWTRTYLPLYTCRVRAWVRDSVRASERASARASEQA